MFRNLLLSPYRQQVGFALPAAVFVLVILSGLAAFAASLASFQHSGSSLEVVGQRVYHAARSGLEWGMYQVLSAPSSACNATGTDLVFATDSLQGIKISVRCQALNVDELDAGQLVEITATACNAPLSTSPACPGNAANNNNYVERKMSAVVEKP